MIRPIRIKGTITLIAGSFMTLMELNIAGFIWKRGLFEATGITMTTTFRQTLHQILVFKGVWNASLSGQQIRILPCRP